LINEIRKQGRLTRNSTTLRICSYSVECASCKTNFDITVSFDDDIKNHTCNACGHSVDESNIVRVNKPELSLESVFLTPRYRTKSGKGGINDQSECDASDKTLPVLSGAMQAPDDKIIDKCDIDALISELENDDPAIAKFVRLYCCEDYSIYAAAKAVGLSGTGATLKLKGLQQRRKKIRNKINEMLGRS
jgi:rRNA maturation endonuclease Nob1